MKYIFGFFLVVGIALLSWFGYFYSQIRVNLDSIVNYNPKLTTQIFDEQGNLIANVFDEENRQYIKYDDIPPRIIEALVAIEDTAFFEHNGINYEAIFRAIVKDIKTMSLAEGASTLTQQLIKNMVLTRDKKFTRKLKEMILSYKLEVELSKEEIIERYLNEVYFGHQYHGIKTAALGYFKKDLKDLSLKEIAILVGLPKAPSSYDPTKHADLSISRANNVIFRMKELGWITNEEYEKSINETPIVYDETLTQNKAPYLVDEALKEAAKYYPDIKTGGYKINLTANLKVQEMAKNALRYGYNEILKRDKNASIEVLNGAIIVMKPQSGDILALVGGVDYAKSSFNRATQSLRQPGSSFKPFIYQIALNMGYSTVSELKDIPAVFENTDKDNKDWKPKNYGNDFLGFISMREALKKSRNLATINLLSDIGISKIIKELKKIGFKDIPPNLSIALGSFGISLFDFAKYYSIFANMGVMQEPILVKSIVSKNGEVKEFQSNSQKVQQPEQAYLMVDLLKSVVTSGTGTSASVGGIEIAGKTGTTNNNVDAWFCGFTPELEVIIWYGNDNNTPMRKVETGSRTAAPVFREFMKNYIKAFPETKRTFNKPKNVSHGVYRGKDELYTTTSPFPKVNNPVILNEEKEDFIF